VRSPREYVEQRRVHRLGPPCTGGRLVRSPRPLSAESTYARKAGRQQSARRVHSWCTPRAASSARAESPAVGRRRAVGATSRRR
jgi:hypothetical protein